MEDIITPVMESATILACHYAKACGRDTVTGMDVAYGLMYATQNVTGKQIGTLFPEIYEESDSDEDDIEEVDDSDEPFTRYEGDEELYVNMNTCADTWDSWEPTSPIEHILKSAVEKAKTSL
jgi:hypothetical protein